METIITCPNCGAEYLPAEIYYPDDFFGRPMNIEKDFRGKIQFYKGKSLTTNESYTCDYCKRKIHVTADVVFNTEIQPFAPQHVTKFKKPGLFMDEN